MEIYIYIIFIKNRLTIIRIIRYKEIGKIYNATHSDRPKHHIYPFAGDRSCTIAAAIFAMLRLQRSSM